MQVAAIPELSLWKLYLVDWGYNTVEEKARAQANPRIDVVNYTQFADLVKRPAAVES